MSNPTPCLEITGDCTACVPAAYQYKFTLSGITNNSCTACASGSGTWNRTYTLTHEGTSCTWSENVSLGCNVVRVVLTMSGSPPTPTWVVEIRKTSGPGLVRVQWSNTSIKDCLKSNNLTKVSDLNDCSGVPTTIKVSPV